MVIASERVTTNEVKIRGCYSHVVVYHRLFTGAVKESPSDYFAFLVLKGNTLVLPQIWQLGIMYLPELLYLVGFL